MGQAGRERMQKLMPTDEQELRNASAAMGYSMKLLEAVKKVPAPSTHDMGYDQGPPERRDLNPNTSRRQLQFQRHKPL